MCVLIKCASMEQTCFNHQAAVASARGPARAKRPHANQPAVSRVYYHQCPPCASGPRHCHSWARRGRRSLPAKAAPPPVPAWTRRPPPAPPWGCLPAGWRGHPRRRLRGGPPRPAAPPASRARSPPDLTGAPAPPPREGSVVGTGRAAAWRARRTKERWLACVRSSSSRGAWRWPCSTGKAISTRSSSGCALAAYASPPAASCAWSTVSP